MIFPRRYDGMNVVVFNREGECEMLDELILEQIRELPELRKYEVLDFIEFLKTKLRRKNEG